MKKRPFLHHRESFLHGSFLEKRRVFNDIISRMPNAEEGGNVDNNGNIVFTENLSNLQNLVDNNQQNLKKEELRMGITTYKTRVDSRGSFENISEDLRADLDKYSQSGAFHRPHFEALVLENIPENADKNSDTLQKSLESQAGVLDPNHTTDSIGNQNIVEWLRPEDKGKDAKNSLKWARKWETKKQEIFAKNVLIHVQKIGLSFQNNPTKEAEFFKKIQKIFTKIEDKLSANSGLSQSEQAFIAMSEINSFAEGENLSSLEETNIERIKVVLQRGFDVLISIEDEEILSPDSGPWVQKIQNLKDIIKEDEKDIEILNLLNPKTDDIRFAIYLREVSLSLSQSELDLRESYQSEYNDINPQEKAYGRFFDGKKERLKDNNPTAALSQLSEYYKWIETEVFHEGISLPASDRTHAFLTANLYRGNISTKGLKSGLEKLAKSGNPTRNHQLNTVQKKNSLVGFYDDVAHIINENNPQKKNTQIADFLEEYYSFFNQKTLGEFNIIFTQPEKRGDKKPQHAQKIGESFEVGFESTYGISSGKMWSAWKKTKSIPIESGGIDKAGQKKIAGNVFPVALWFNEKGALNLGDGNLGDFQAMMKSLIPPKIALSVKNGTASKKVNAVVQKIFARDWNESDTEVLNFIKTVQGNFIKHKTLNTKAGHLNPEFSGQKAIDEFKKSREGGTLTDFAQNVLDEAMDGNPAYIALLAIAGWGFFKNPKLRNGLLFVGGGMALNEVVRNETGVDYFEKTKEAVMGTNDVQKGNVASWVTHSMDRNKELEGENIDSTKFERAATVLGSVNFADSSTSKDIVGWYSQTQKFLDNPNGITEKEAYLNDNMPECLSENLKEISGNNVKPEENARIAFVFLTKYFRHIDMKERNITDPAQASSENGYKILTDKYPENSPVRLSQIYLERTTIAEKEYLATDPTKVEEIFGEYSHDALNFMGSTMRGWGLDLPHVLDKFREIKNDAKKLGLEIKIAVKDEFTFFDNTKKVGGKIKKVGEEWVLEPLSGFVGLGATGTGYKTFEDAWEGVKKGVNIVQAKAMRLQSKWVAFLNETDQEILDDVIVFSDKTYAVNNKINKNQELLRKAVDEMNMLDEISDTYGFDRPEYANKALLELAKKPEFLISLKKIAQYRIKIDQKSKGAGSTVLDVDIKITKQDLITYFFSNMYGVGMPLQGGIDLARAGAEQVSRVASGTVGVLSDSGEAFLDTYGGDSALRMFWQDNIDGNKDFRKLSQKISRDSVTTSYKNFKTLSANPPGTPTPVDMIWTSGLLQNVAFNEWEKNISRNIREKVGHKSSVSIDTVDTMMKAEFKRYFASQDNRNRFYQNAMLGNSTVRKGTAASPGIGFKNGPSYAETKAQIKVLAEEWLKKIDNDREIK